MKSLKSTKFAVLIISVALLVAGIVGITASAEDTDPSLEIFSKNLSYGGTISIAFAVDAQNINADDVELLIYSSVPTDGAEVDYTVKTSEAATIHEREALVFLTPGIAAKDMTKQIYVKAHAVVDGTDVYSELERYSVAEYAYDMQYRSKINENFIKLGAALLEVGEQIQTLLPYNVDNSPADFVYIAAESGTVDGEYAAGLFKAGETVTLNYTGEIPTGKAVIWNSEAGSVANGTPFTASAHGFYKASFVNAYTPGVYYNDETMIGTRHDDTLSAVGAGALLGIENNALGTFEAGTTYIVETDFTYNGGAYKGSSPAFFGLLSAGGTVDNKNMFLFTYIYQYDESANSVSIFGYEFLKGEKYNIRMEYTVGDGDYLTGSSNDAVASRNEYLRSGFKFFVNGVEVDVSAMEQNLMTGENLRDGIGADADFFGLGVKVRGSSYASSDFSVSFDNTFIAPKVEIDEVKLEKSYFENTDIAGTRLDFADASDLDSVVQDNSHSSNGNRGNASIVNGALNVSGNPVWYGLLFETASFDASKTYAQGTKYIFEADITFNGGESAGSDKGAAFSGFITQDYGTDIRNGDMSTFKHLLYENSNANLDLYGADIKKGETHKITIIYTVGTKETCEVYLDLVKIADASLSKTDGLADTNCAGFGFYFRGTSYTKDLDLTFDNVFVGVIEAE